MHAEQCTRNQHVAHAFCSRFGIIFAAKWHWRNVALADGMVDWEQLDNWTAECIRNQQPKNKEK